MSIDKESLGKTSKEFPIDELPCAGCGINIIDFKKFPQGYLYMANFRWLIALCNLWNIKEGSNRILVYCKMF